MDEPTWKDKLKGATDLIFMFGRGIKPFEQGNVKKNAIQSIWIPVIMFPLGLISTYFWPPADLADRNLPMSHILVSTFFEGLISVATGLGLLWAACVAFDRRERFWVAFQAGNWTAIPMSLISLPFLILAIFHWYDREVMDRIFTFILYYGFLVGACVYYRGLKIHWEWAGFLSCMGVVLGQMTQNFTDWMNNVPIR